MYECGENVSSVETLVKIGQEKLGVTDGEVLELLLHLENNVGAKDVMKEIQLGKRRYNIQGVPHFIVGAVVDGGESGGSSSLGKPYGFSGAQDSSAFIDMFEDLAASIE
eukprot:842920_1